MSLGRTVAELRRTISSREFVEWMAFYQVEPFGEEAEYLRTGIVAATIANVNRSVKQKPLSALDFMPFHDGKRTADEQEAMYDPDPEKQSRMLEAFFNGIASTA